MNLQDEIDPMMRSQPRQEESSRLLGRRAWLDPRR